MSSSSRDKRNSSSEKNRSSSHRDHEKKERRRSSSHEDKHDDKKHHDADVVQDANQVDLMDQESDELIFIKDSCNIKVHSTNTQAAVSLQIALQLAIAIVIRITILDSADKDGVVQDLLQHFETEQTNKQKIFIENSKDVTVKTTDTDLSVNIQALLQVLLTLVAKVDIL
ncbi:spore coat protein [Neobacillus cucumis]|uniref:spore coat protein n=1 Tax=Neobacillus cucumis TaxID=1740721 RepID=UPI0020407F82|nr:spore coat protein [Neobacillus cucumis]MCM3728042.1 spore coat protein [Neobacillus cucumis]